MIELSSSHGTLVTGASGFIGSVLCERLARENVPVRALMRREAEGPWDQASCIDIGGTQDLLPSLRDIDAVFHLAAKVHAVSGLDHKDTEYTRINVEGTRRLLDAAVRAGVRTFIFLSSVKAMGEGSDDCMDETREPAPQTAYGCSKLEAERLVTKAGSRHGLHTVNLRLPLVYGAGGKGNLARMLEAVARGRFPPLPEVGNKRSMIHVADVAEAAVLAAGSSRANGKTYIVTDGTAYSTRQIYALMCQALGKRISTWAVPASVLVGAAAVGDRIGRARGRRFSFDSDALEKLMGSAWYSSAKIERELGFRPSRCLEQALPEMVAALERTPRVGVTA